MALADPLAIADFYDLFKVQDVQFVQGFQQQRSATGGGETHFADRAPSLWRAEVTTIPMSHAEAEGIMALINSRAGGLKTVLLYNKRLPFPPGDPTGTWLSTGSNLPVGGQSISFDFAGDAYEVEGRDVVASSVVSCARSTVGYAINTDGTLEAFAANVPRITDLGLLVEPARAGNMLWSMDLGTTRTEWVAESGLAKSIAPGAPIEGQVPTRFTWTGTGLGRVSQSFMSSASPYVLQAIVKGTAAARYACFRSMLPDAGAAYHNAVFDLTAGVVGYLAPAFTSSRMTELGDGWWLIEAECVATVAANKGNYLYVCNNPIPSNAFVAPTAGMDYFDVAYFNILTGSGLSTPVLTAATTASRAADVVTIDLPPGTHDLSITSDVGLIDASGESVSYTLPSTERRLIASAVGTKTALTPGVAASPKLGTITDRLQVAFTGFPAGYEIPLGTYFSIVFDTSRYYLGQFAEARTADGSGAVASVEIWPPLPASIIGTPDVLIVKPPGKFRIVPGSAYPTKEGGLHSTIKFSAEQTYSG